MIVIKTVVHSSEKSCCDSNVFSAVVHCPDLKELPNGHFTGNGTSYQSTALYECSEGYLLIGTAMVSCQATGQWTSSTPTCASKQCMDLLLSYALYKFNCDITVYIII